MSIDATLLFVFLSFVFFTLLMKSFFFDPIARIKQQRELKLAEDKDQAVSYLQEREKLHGQYEADLAAAKRRAQQVILEGRQKAKSAASQTVMTAREKAASEVEAQLAQLAEWREEAYRKLDQEREALTRMIVQKVVGKNVDDKVPAVSMEH